VAGTSVGGKPQMGAFSLNDVNYTYIYELNDVNYTYIYELNDVNYTYIYELNDGKIHV
jgi:hypothetical protein